MNSNTQIWREKNFDSDNDNGRGFVTDRGSGGSDGKPFLFSVFAALLCFHRLAPSSCAYKPKFSLFLVPLSKNSFLCLVLSWHSQYKNFKLVSSVVILLLFCFPKFSQLSWWAFPFFRELVSEDKKTIVVFVFVFVSLFVFVFVPCPWCIHWCEWVSCIMSSQFTMGVKSQRPRLSVCSNECELTVRRGRSRQFTHVALLLKSSPPLPRSGEQWLEECPHLGSSSPLPPPFLNLIVQSNEPNPLLPRGVLHS